MYSFHISVVNLLWQFNFEKSFILVFFIRSFLSFVQHMIIRFIVTLLLWEWIGSFLFFQMMWRSCLYWLIHILSAMGFFIMFGIVVFLECLDISSEWVASDTFVNLLPRIYISQGIYTVTGFLSLISSAHLDFFPYWINYPPLVHDRDLVMYSKSFCIIDTIKSRIWYHNISDPDPPLVIIDISIDSNKVINGYDFLPFPWVEVVFIW